MADRKFLFKRGGVWNVRFRLPDRYGGGFFQRSLGTGDITTAKRFRDLYVAPFLRDDDEYAAIKDLVEKAVRVRAAEDKKYDRLLQVLSGDEEPGEGAESLRALVDKYLAHIARGDISPATLQAYTSHLEGFLQVVGEERAATSIEKQDLVVFRDKLLSLPVNWMRLQHIPPAHQVKKKVSKATVSTALTYVRGFFQWLIDEGPFESRLNPVQGVKVPFTKVNNRRPFTRAEVEQACEIPYPTRHTKFDEEAWKSLPRIARYTGARLGEIAQLNGKDVVEVHGIPCLHIYANIQEGKTTKTHDDRLVPIAKKIQPLLNTLRKTHGEGPLFPHCGTWTDKNFGVVKQAKQFSNVFQRSVKKVAPDVTFHSFRHYAITEMANAGIPEEVRMRIVGHKAKTVHQGYTLIDVQTMARAVDRLGRSLQNLLEFLAELHALGIDLYLHQQGIDTTTPAGKAMFQMCGVFAEFERSIIRERIGAGLARARANGKRLGWPRVDPDVEEAIQQALRKGDKGMRKIAREMGVGVSVVQRVRSEGAAT